MPRWRKSSRSHETQCVEVAVAVEGVLVRDSKDLDGPVITVSKAAWRSFIADLKRLS